MKYQGGHGPFRGLDAPFALRSTVQGGMDRSQYRYHYLVVRISGKHKPTFLVVIKKRYHRPKYWSFRVILPSSARLTFRSWTGEDTALAEALWCDPEVTHYFGGAMTREQAHDRLDVERERENRLGIQYWPMFLRETGEFAGCAGLREWQMDPRTIEAGVHLMRSVWGQRLGEEALRAVLAHGFDTLGLQMIVAGHGIGHDNSQKLLERIGFEYTHNIMWGPKAIEVRMYAITAGIWHLTGTREESA